MLYEQAQLDLVACDVEESGVWSEDLAEDVLREAAEAGARKMDEGERDGKKGDGDTVGHYSRGGVPCR